MHRWYEMALCGCFLLYFSVPSVNAVSAIVQYQEWFNDYAHVNEQLMQVKRAINSNETLIFNIKLLGILANATFEMRQVDNTTEVTIEQSETISRPCQQLVMELFKVFRAIGQAELQACAAFASQELRYWTTQRFFSYANIVHRDLTELTHRVSLILEQYNKVTNMDDIRVRLDDEYYRFNSYNNALQEVLNNELERFYPEDHPLREGLLDCLDTTVTLHQQDMEYVLSYIDNACGVGQANRV